MIKLSSFVRNPSVGVFARASERMAFVPSNSPEKFARDLREALEVEVHATEIAETSLIGAMMVINDHGIVLPRNTTESELAFIKGFDAKVGVVEDRHTALGNLVIANDKGAVASRLLSNRAVKEISDALDVEVIAHNFKNFKTVGSIGVATPNGALVHPILSEEDLQFLGKILKVEADIGTVNRGVGYVRTGIIANSKGAVIGNETTSPEIARIEDALSLL